eukprot:jgi/Antlo1/2299/1
MKRSPVLNIAFAIRMIGDLAHVASMFVLVEKIRKTRSFSGLSYKTQLLKMIVFLTRYLDIFSTSYSESLHVYNTIMKIAYMTFQALLLYTIRFKYFHTYDAELDNFVIEMLVIPCTVLALVISSFQGAFSFVSILYNLSLLLESVAILPQLVQLQKMQESETLTSRYIFLLGIYRLLYLLNWILKKSFGYDIDELLLATGILQTLLYLHFFFLYYGYVFRKQSIIRIPK